MDSFLIITGIIGLSSAIALAVCEYYRLYTYPSYAKKLFDIAFTTDAQIAQLIKVVDELDMEIQKLERKINEQ